MYILASLSKQRSHGQSKKRSKSDEKAPQSTPQSTSEQKTETATPVLVMPIEEAKTVIASYAPAAPTVELPVALQELYAKIVSADEELTEARLEALPKDERGFEILPADEDEQSALYRGIDLPEYLRLKYPNATYQGSTARPDRSA